MVRFMVCRKHKMTLKVSDRRKGALLDDLEREKDNIFYCLHPAVSKVIEEHISDQMNRSN